MYTTPFEPPRWTDFASHAVFRYTTFIPVEPLFFSSLFFSHRLGRRFFFFGIITTHVNRLCLEPGERETGYKKSFFSRCLFFHFHDTRCAIETADELARQQFLGSVRRFTTSIGIIDSWFNSLTRPSVCLYTIGLSRLLSRTAGMFEQSGVRRSTWRELALRQIIKPRGRLTWDCMRDGGMASLLPLTFLFLFGISGHGTHPHLHRHTCLFFSNGNSSRHISHLFLMHDRYLSPPLNPFP